LLACLGYQVSDERRPDDEKSNRLVTRWILVDAKLI
jgi:hypothetical protein